jgi:membrane peptidoglycan carboxypeptidase
VYGASTITQQMVKNVFLSHQRTWARKISELGLSVLVELMWGKARIMEIYLNVIYMGANVYGIEAAAQHYFHKRAINLNKREAVMIAISLPSPKRFNPARPSKYMQARHDQVCEIMDKLMKYGWYKDVRTIKQIKVNYLDDYPSSSSPRSIDAANKKYVENTRDTIYLQMNNSTENTTIADDDTMN